MEADFSGYATKAGIKCSDGRTIMPHAFKDNDGMRVPLIWQHAYGQPENVLGHAILENREDGVYAYAFLNDTPQGQTAKALVQHGDVTMFSIYANKLIEKSKQVFHGAIREVSLVLAGANPEAKIDYVSLAHSDGTVEELEDEAVIFSGESFDEVHVEHADGDDEDETTVQDVYDAMTEEQKKAVDFMIGAALEAEGDKKADENKKDDASNQEDGSASHSSTENGSGEKAITHKEGEDMPRNVFDQNAVEKSDKKTISHSDLMGIVADAQKRGSLKEAVEDYALEHGIENMEVMFPDAKALDSRPEFLSRRMEWVKDVMSGTRHSPFSRVKTLHADITEDEARAKGYIKGNFKKEEFFKVAKRTTAPTTVYKKQKLDRDDIIDITDFDVVTWLKAEMRLMLEEELARAILIGDGRAVDDEDKIKDPEGAQDGIGIRSIAHDHELYATRVYLESDATPQDMVDAVITSRVHYKGSGMPTLFTTESWLTKALLARDTMGRRLYKTEAELASELRVSKIVPVEVMEGETDVVGIIVNLSDYTIGSDKGGEVNLFDDFDIDYNQYKYLIETRSSGALTKLKSALVLLAAESGDQLATPTRPAFDSATNTITIPTVTGVVYKEGNTTVNAGAKVITKNTTITAVPAEGYYFASSENDEWNYTYKAP